MNFDEKVKQFQDDLVNLINNAGLPLSVVSLVLGQTLQIVNQTMNAPKPKEEQEG